MENIATVDKPHVVALKKAIEVAGGTQAALAERMRPHCGERTPSQQLISYWLKKGTYIDPEWWPAIEKAVDLAVTRRDLRPDIFQ